MKEFAPLRSKLFSFRVDPFSEEDWCPTKQTGSQKLSLLSKMAENVPVYPFTLRKKAFTSGILYERDEEVVTIDQMSLNLAPVVVVTRILYNLALFVVVTRILYNLAPVVVVTRILYNLALFVVVTRILYNLALFVVTRILYIKQCNGCNISHKIETNIFLFVL